MLQQRDVKKRGFFRFAALKKKFPHLKTILGIGGLGEGAKKYSQMASMPSRRKTFTSSVVGNKKKKQKKNKTMAMNESKIYPTLIISL